MITLDNMRNRLNYNGGTAQQSRMIEHKLQSLKKALLYSYQAGTMIIDNPDEDNTLEYLEFRCLMNPDKRTFDADKMMLSVPFEDVCLNVPASTLSKEGAIPVPVACGKTFIWKETNTRWIITLQYIEEYAYFRADVRKCFEFPLTINDKDYYFASVGENEEIIEWTRRNREDWNKMNYTRTLYIERNSDTLDYFNRFKIVKLPDIQGNLETWEVQAVSPNAVDNVLIVYVKEYFENQYAEVSAEEQEKKQEQYVENEYLVCKAYDNFDYTTDFIENAIWTIDNITNSVKPVIKDAIIQDNKTTVYIQLMNGKTGEFDLIYNNEVVKHVVVESL